MGVDAAYESHINQTMRDEIQTFLKDFDSYGYKKIICEEQFTEYATRHAG